jgi:hypothetical protein
MGKEPHNFREFFTLIAPPKKTANKRAVCNFCIKEYILSVDSVKVDCFVLNKAKLCQGHLIKYISFKNQVLKNERIEILARTVPEDNKKITKKRKIDKGKSVNIDNNSGIKYLIVPIILKKIKFFYNN